MAKRDILLINTGGGGGGGTDPTEYSAVANSSGNTTITPASGKTRATRRITISGSAGTRIFILATTDREAGDRVEINFVLPNTASIVLEIRNATAGGTLIYNYTTKSDDATNGYRLRTIMEYDGSAWQPVEALYPAI